MTSIIIPVHKEKDNLRNLINELSWLKGIDASQIIVALSPESNYSPKAEDSTEVRFLNCTKKGRASQMNEASKIANGDILVFLHADVRPPKSFLNDIQRTIKSGYDAGFFSYKFDKENFFLRMNSSFTGKDSIFTGGGDQCLFIRKSVFEDLGRFNEEQLLMEDFEFFKRMKKNKVPYRIVQNDLIVSARKYEKNSYVRVNLSNLLLVALFNLGYPGKKLKYLHDRLLRVS